MIKCLSDILTGVPKQNLRRDSVHYPLELGIIGFEMGFRHALGEGLNRGVFQILFQLRDKLTIR